MERDKEAAYEIVNYTIIENKGVMELCQFRNPLSYYYTIIENKGVMERGLGIGGKGYYYTIIENKGVIE